MKASSTVLNGECEETYHQGNAPGTYPASHHGARDFLAPSPRGAHTMRIARYGKTRFWAVYNGAAGKPIPYHIYCP